MTLVYIVCANDDEAARISEHLLRERLCACTNRFPIQSAYWWQGEIQHDCEVVLLAKTVDRLAPALAEAARSLHSYEAPAIFTLPAPYVLPAYAAWLEGEVRGDGEGSAE